MRGSPGHSVWVRGVQVGKERKGHLLLEEKSGAPVLVGSEAMVGQIGY